MEVETTGKHFEFMLNVKYGWMVLKCYNRLIYNNSYFLAILSALKNNVTKSINIIIRIRLICIIYNTI